MALAGVGHIPAKQGGARVAPGPGEAVRSHSSRVLVTGKAAAPGEGVECLPGGDLGLVLEPPEAGGPVGRQQRR